MSRFVSCLEMGSKLSLCVLYHVHVPHSHKNYYFLFTVPFGVDAIAKYSDPYAVSNNCLHCRLFGTEQHDGFA
jgi:hypothetical protein